MKDDIAEAKEEYKAIGLCGFGCKLFEEEEGEGVQEGLDGYPYFTHLIQLCPGDWVEQVRKMNEAVGEKNSFDNSGGKKLLVHHFTRNEFWKCIGCILSVVIYGIKVNQIWGETETSVSKQGKLHHT